MADGPPKSITSGDASRGSVVHASDADIPGILSRSHKEEDISRLQNAANNYVNALQYNVGDFVRESNKLYICKVATSPPENFSFNNFRIPNNADQFGVNDIDDFIEDLPKFLGTETGVEENVKAYKALDISRARNASRPYSSTQEYAIGDFTFFDGRQVRNTTAIDSNGESFDTTHWEPADGLGVKNTKHIYSEADFPPIESINSIDRHPLDNNTEYIISQPLSVSTGLFVDAGFKVLMRSFSTEENVLTFNPAGSDALFTTLDFDGSFTGVVDVGAGEIQLTGMVTTNLEVGRHININQTSSTATVDYSQLAAEIVTVDSGTELTVKTSVEFVQTESGDWDNKARLLELERTTFDNIGSGTSFFILADFTRFKTSEFFMFHCEAENFDNFGSVTNCNIAIYSLNEFENINDKVKLIDCESVLIDSNNWRGTQGAGQQLIQIEDAIGESIANINNNNLLTTGSGTNAIAIISLTDTSRVIVTNNADLNPDAGSLFSNLDETDKRLIVKSNTRQKDSKTTAFGVLVTANPAVPFLVEPGGINAIQPVDTTAGFTFSNEERMIGDVDTGAVQYLGVDDTVLRVEAKTAIMSSVGNLSDTFIVFTKSFGAYVGAETVNLIGETSGASGATASITVNDHDTITAVGSFGGVLTGYSDTEVVRIEGQTSGATNGRGTATVSGGNLTAVAVTDGGGFIEVSKTRQYLAVNATALRHISTHIITDVSTLSAVRPEFGSFTSAADLEVVNISITAVEV